MDSTNHDSIFNCMTCFTFASLFLSLSATCVGITMVAKGIRTERSVQSLYMRLRTKLQELRIFCEDYHVRMLVEQYLSHGEFAVEDVMNRGIYVYWWAIPVSLQDQYSDCSLMLMTRHLYLKLMARRRVKASPQLLEELEAFQSQLVRSMEDAAREKSSSVADREELEQEAVLQKLLWELREQRLEAFAVDFALMQELETHPGMRKKGQALYNAPICRYRQIGCEEMTQIDPSTFRETVQGVGIKGQVSREYMCENPKLFLGKLFAHFSAGGFMTSREFTQFSADIRLCGAELGPEKVDAIFAEIASGGRKKTVFVSIDPNSVVSV